jgi:hypothetical protein
MKSITAEIYLHAPIDDPTEVLAWLRVRLNTVRLDNLV